MTKGRLFDSFQLLSESKISRVLLPGDLEHEGEALLLASGHDLSADLLKAPHHGSKTSSTDEFLDAVNPELAVISCGRRNKFDAFIPAGRYVPDAGFASVFLKQGLQTAIVIDLQATTLNVLNVDGANDAATGTDLWRAAGPKRSAKS